MDPATHAALGATVALAGFRRLGRRALAVGAAVAVAPDLDIPVSGAFGPLGLWLHHRAITHSLPFAAVVGPLLGWLIWRGLGRAGRKLPWMGLCTAALLSHAFLDLTNHYGTLLLAPVSDHRFAIPAMPVVDPVFSAVLAAAVAAGVWWRRADAAAVAAWAALMLCTAYVFAAWGLNAAIEGRARRQLAEAGAPAMEVRAYPTMLQPFFRRVVARGGDEVLVGYQSALAPAPITWRRWRNAAGPAVAAAAATPEAAVLEWLSDGQMLWRVATENDVTVVEGRDLRYGLDGEIGLWGIRTALTPEGLPAASPEIFRAGSELTAENVERLARLVLDR